MARIDAHQHFWVYDPVEYDWINQDMQRLQRDFLPEDLNPLLAEADMQGCVAVQARHTESENDFLLGLADDHPQVMGVVSWLDLRADNLEERMQHYRGFEAFKGVRHIVQGEPDPDFILAPDFIRGIKALAKAGLTYDILVFERQFPAVLTFLERCPDQPFVLDHLGKPAITKRPSPTWTEGIRVMAEHPNVHCKVSGLVTEGDWSSWQPDDFKPYLDVVFGAFGPERMMYGSDWPVCLLAADKYASVLALVDEYTASFDDRERAAFFGGNAERFYNL